jgi:hypothetical protein
MAKHTRYVPMDFGSDPVVHTPVEEPRSFAMSEAPATSAYVETHEEAAPVRTYTRKRRNPALWVAPLALLAALGWWALSDRGDETRTETAASEQLQVAEAEPAAAMPAATPPAPAVEPVEAVDVSEAPAAPPVAAPPRPRAAPVRRTETARAAVRPATPAPAADEAAADVSATVEADAAITAPAASLPPLPEPDTAIAETPPAAAAPSTLPEPATEPVTP